MRVWEWTLRCICLVGSIYLVRGDADSPEVEVKFNPFPAADLYSSSSSSNTSTSISSATQFQQEWDFVNLAFKVS